jgi:hypothetical protein
MSGRGAGRRRTATASPRGYKQFLALPLHWVTIFAEQFLMLCPVLSCLGQVRREKISQRMKLLQDLVPGCNKVLQLQPKITHSQLQLLPFE